MAQLIPEPLVLLGELSKVGNLIFLLELGSSNVQRAGAHLSHLEVFACLTALRLLEHGRLLLPEVFGALGRVHNSCNFV